MGGSVSYAGPGSLADLREIELTEREKHLIRVTWEKLQSQKREVSVDIFIRIFEQIPQAKQLFPFRNEENELLIKHPYFKGHAMRFINAIGMTIVNLDAWEVILIPSLLRLGQQHANIPGFKPEYFITFHQAMHDTLSKHLGRTFTAETKTAWSKICRLITSTVEQGYMEGQATNARRLNSTEESGQTKHGESNEHGNVSSNNGNSNVTCPEGVVCAPPTSHRCARTQPNNTSFTEMPLTEEYFSEAGSSADITVTSCDTISKREDSPLTRHCDINHLKT